MSRIHYRRSKRHYHRGLRRLNRRRGLRRTQCQHRHLASKLGVLAEVGR